MPYSYNCGEYPGMESCPGFFVANSGQEVFKHVELHTREAHGEDPAQWSGEDLQMVKNLIRRTDGPGVSLGAGDVDFEDQARRAASEIPTAEFISLEEPDHVSAHLAGVDLLLPAVLRTLRGMDDSRSA